MTDKVKATVTGCDKDGNTIQFPSNLSVNESGTFDTTEIISEYLDRGGVFKSSNGKSYPIMSVNYEIKGDGSAPKSIE